MDGSESLTINDAEIQASLLFSLESRLPKIKRGTMDYINTFKFAATDAVRTPESIELVKALHETRALMETKIDSSTPSLREIESALDEYLPNLYLITWSLRTQPDVPISRPLHFEWRGSFTNDANFSRFDVFAYDLVMVLHSKVYNLLLCIIFISCRHKFFRYYFRRWCILCGHRCSFGMIQPIT